MLKLFFLKIWNILCKKEFWFVIIIYPGMFYIAKLLLSLLKKPTNDYATYFGFVTFTLFLIIIFSSVAEIFTRKFKHELQGEKLKIREREGVDILDSILTNK